ncbi:MAG: hypothetical protein QX189_09300 [Methylococcales bacterium]
MKLLFLIIIFFSPVGFCDLSVYQTTDICTQPMIQDGTLCPDYLVGGCASRRECDEVLEDREKLAFEHKRKSSYQDFNQSPAQKK